jgi:hypothetical protein
MLEEVHSSRPGYFSRVEPLTAAPPRAAAALLASRPIDLAPASLAAQISAMQPLQENVGFLGNHWPKAPVERDKDWGAMVVSIHPF